MSRLLDAFRTFFAPGTGKRRKGKKPVTRAPESTYEPYVLDMAEVSDTLMRGLTQQGIGIFRTTPAPQSRRIRVTATLPPSARELHPLARTAKQLVRPEDADRISPTLFHASGKPGLRIKLSAPVPLPRRSPEAPAIPPKPTTPPPLHDPVSDAHSASPVRTVEETDELYRGPGWEALFLAQSVFGADTLDMPAVETPQQAAHVCKHCKELHSGVTFGARIWRCDSCKVIATY